MSMLKIVLFYLLIIWLLSIVIAVKSVGTRWEKITGLVYGGLSFALAILGGIYGSNC